MSVDEELTLPDLSTIPTVPPPPDPIPEPVRRAPRPKRRKARGGIGRMLALILGTQACLVSSAVLVAVGHPSVAVAVGAVVVTDAFVVSAVTTMVSLLGRGQ